MEGYLRAHLGFTLSVIESTHRYHRLQLVKKKWLKETFRCTYLCKTNKIHMVSAFKIEEDQTIVLAVD